MLSASISHLSSTIHYIRYGQGRQNVFCFHGFAEDASSFSILEKYSREEFSFFAIDLPFHGKTEWKEGLVFTQNDLNQIIEHISEQEKITGQQFSLLAFSLGGRIALSLYESNPSKIEKLVLLAPDGLKINAWYWLATQTWLGNRFFLLTMNRPGWFFWFLKLLNKLKLVNTSIFKFVNYYISDKEVRRQLYERWTGLRKFKPDLPNIRRLVRTQQTPVRLIYGKHDRIILSSVGERFQKGIEEYCTVTVINSGHQILQEKHAGEILNALLH
jgi:pimeloyl-ACP methyl ester carboxylesterase